MHNTADLSKPKDPERGKMRCLARGRFGRAAAFLLELTSLDFNKQSLPEVKIPIGTDTGSGFASFFFAFLMQAVAKNCRAPKIHMRDICSSTAGDAELFQVNSTSWGTSDQKKKIPIWTLPRKWQHWSSVQIQQLLTFIWKQLLTQHWHSSRISTYTRKVIYNMILWMACKSSIKVFDL